jgi:hypothetical protein
MDKDEIIKELAEKNAKLEYELQATKEHLKIIQHLHKMPDIEARTPCLFSNFVFHHFNHQRRSGKS